MTHSKKSERKYQEISSTCDEQKQRYTSSASGLGKCDVHIHIKHVDTINICNCPSDSKIQPPEDATCQDIDYSDCIPLAANHKPKQGFQSRVSYLLQNNKVPSVLAAAFFQQARRFLQGTEPENELEVQAFAVFRKLPTSTRSILECTLQKYDADSRKSRLFAHEIDQFDTTAISAEKLASFVAQELVRRTSVYYFDDPDCFDAERPGLLRQQVQNPNDDVGSPTNIIINAVNGFRTSSHVPLLALGEYRDEEIQQICTPEIQGESVVVNCQPQTNNCVGNSVDGVCLRVSDVMPEDAVLLQGFNFFDIDGKVRLIANAPSTVEREVEVFVCGDISTGLTETVNGVERVILDSRVKDQILFTVPGDLPEGVYGITVVMPLDGDDLVSQPQFIRVLPAATTTFQIASEELKAIDETSPSWAGSDEVGIKILSTAITSDGEVGTLSSNDFKFGNVDSGNVRDMSRVLFQQDNIRGAIVSILGHEIDNDNLYQKEVESFEDAFEEILKSNWSAISGALGALGAGAAVALSLGGGWAAAIGAAITFSVNAIVAYVGRADLIIEDTIALTALDLATRTSINSPAPEPISFSSPGGINVTAEADSKNVQYMEKRTYKSGEEGSKYRITFRYNRV